MPFSTRDKVCLPIQATPGPLRKVTMPTAQVVPVPKGRPSTGISSDDSSRQQRQTAVQANEYSRIMPSTPRDPLAVEVGEHALAAQPDIDDSVQHVAQRQRERREGGQRLRLVAGLEVDVPALGDHQAPRPPAASRSARRGR